MINNMAIFGTKKAKEAKSSEVKEVKAVKAVKAVKPAKAVKAVAVAPISSKVNDDNAVIVKPRITEKSGIMSQSGVYTFEVTKRANKATVSKAVASMYKVSPVKVAIINTPARNVFVKGRRGVVSGMKKAVVTLKKGEKIDFV